MSDVKKFDNHFKEQFSNYDADVPSHIWHNIVADRENRKPKGFWVGFMTTKNIAIIAASVIAVSTSVWMIANKKEEAGNNESIIAKNKTTQGNTPVIQQGNTTLFNNETTPVINSSHNNTTTSSTNTSPKDKYSVATDNETSSATLNEDRNSKGNDITINSKTGNYNTKNISATKQHNIPNLAESNTANEDNELDIISQSSFLTTRSETEAEKITVRPVLTTLTAKPRTLSLPECPIMEKDIAGNKKYFEVYAGPDYAIRTFTDTPNSAYLQKRKESTKFSSAYSAGVRYTRVFKSGMSIRGGFNYSQINEKFTFVESNITQVTYIIDPVTGDTTGQFSTSGTRYKTTYNHYRSIDIPVLIGYEFGNGKFHANINAGAMINVYSWQKGEVLDTLNKPISITTSSQSQSPYQYKTNIGVGFTGGVSAYYKITEQMHLLAEPYIRYNLSSMNHEELTLKQKFTTIGLRLGVRFDLR